MKYRSRVDIIASILQAASHGATKTRLMYNSYLSYAQIKEYIDFLTSKRLLSHQDPENLYTLTDEGARFLEAYGQLSSLITLDDNRKIEALNANMNLPSQTGQTIHQLRK